MIDVFSKLISLRVNDNKIVFNMNEGGNCHKVESVCVVNNGNAKYNMENNITSNITA